MEPLEIQLESAGDLVLRGFSGEELEPAVLKGELLVNLSEATTLKDVTLVFSGVAKVTWRDTSTHHHDHPIFYHDFSFLNPAATVPATKHHSHTLQAGHHVFPFSLHIPGSLPASLRTYSGTCVIEYKLKAMATRPGFAADWKARKLVRISRGFGADAVEYNQTLEIENTWPGKVMYAFTIPHKAYAAGDTIPVSVKFSPLAKGVRIVSLITTIREHTTVHTKGSSHSEARDATVIKYNFIPDSSPITSNGPRPTQSTSRSSHASGSHTSVSALRQPPRIDSTASMTSLNHNHSDPSTPDPSFHHPGVHATASRASSIASGSAATWPGLDPRQQQPMSEEPEQMVDDGTDTEVDVVVDVPLPIWTAPTHTIFPCFINHKIKWSAFIKNPDGHVSELRCALPIYILAPSLAEEARLASAGSRNLLFGDSGVLAHSDVPQVDLPSYQDHVMDRVANMETASYFSHAAGFTPTLWSGLSTPMGTPIAGSPMTSPAPSRPGSPGRHFSGLATATLGTNAQSRPAPISSPIYASRHSSGTNTPQLASPSVDMGDHPEAHRNWVDSELMGSLNLDHTSPPGSNPTSRPGSRPGSQPNSRPASPNHGMSSNSSHEPPPLLTRASTSGSGFFSLHLPKPLRPLTAFSRMGSSSSVQQVASGSGSSAHHPSPSALSNALAAHAARAGPVRAGSSADIHTHSPMSNSPMILSTTSSPSSTSPVITTSLLAGMRAYEGGSASPARSPTSAEDQNVDFLSLVPSYSVAARGFLGGGIVPISTTLPNYEDSGE